MERGFEQLVVVALFLLVALLDWIARALKKRGAPRAPAEDERTRMRREPELTRGVPTAEDVLVEEDPEAAAEREWLEAHRDEEEEPGLREPVAAAPVPVPPRRAPALEELMLRRPGPPVLVPAPVVPMPPVVPPPAASPIAARVERRSRARRVHAADARQGIVMMTVLGRCRGLEPM